MNICSEKIRIKNNLKIRTEGMIVKEYMNELHGRTA